MLIHKPSSPKTIISVLVFRKMFIIKLELRPGDVTNKLGKVK